MWKKKLLTVSLILFSLVSLTGFSPYQQADQAQIQITQIDTSAFPRVTVYVSVTDQDGDPYGVDPARIQLMENGERIPLDQIEGAGEVDPLTVLLAMDISGSMLYVGKLDAAKAAARVFVEQLRPVDRVGLLAFHTDITYVQPITTDRDLIFDAINGLEAEQDTAMYDALIRATEILGAEKGRKAIVAITDGLDTVSQSDPESVLSGIDPSGLSISTIGLGDPDQDLAEKTALDVEGLTFLAENAGGNYSYANDQQSLSAIYESYAVAFKSEYQLTYISPSNLKDGVNRALTVSLADAAPAVEGPEEGAVVYNPGGLVPEVSEPAPLAFFAWLMAGLAALLFLPAGINLVINNAGKNKAPAKKKKPTIKLKD